MCADEQFSDYHADLLEGRYDCVDRLVVNAYFAMGQTGGGMRAWWRRLHGDDSKLDNDHLRDMAGTFSRRIRAFCDKHATPLVEAQAGERKHELAEQYLPSAPNYSGLFLVITANAAAPVWDVSHTPDGRIADLHHRKKWPFIKHYHFHLIDPEWGHVTNRMSGYPPFGAQVILNGHEWVQRRAMREQITINKSSNCFIEGSNFEQVNRLALNLNEVMAAGSLRAICERWIYSSCLCFVLTQDEIQRSGFAYQYSIFQLELSRNFLFERGTTMNEVYQGLIDRTRNGLDIKQLKTIFGYTNRPHNKTKRGLEAPELLKSVRTPSYDLTVFKVQWGRLTLKIYDKGARVLRVEVVARNTRDLRCGKVIEKLPVMLTRMKAMLIRCLDTVQVAHKSFLDEGAFEHWCEPSMRGARRLAGIDLNKARNRSVIHALLGLSTKPDGFTVSELAQAVRQRTGCEDVDYTQRHAAYDLAKMRGKHLVERCDRSRRYEVRPQGMRTMCAYLLLREKVIKPVLAGVSRPESPNPDPIAPLDRHYVALRDELVRTFETIGIAA